MELSSEEEINNKLKLLITTKTLNIFPKSSFIQEDDIRWYKKRNKQQEFQTESTNFSIVNMPKSSSFTLPSSIHRKYRPPRWRHQQKSSWSSWTTKYENGHKNTMSSLFSSSLLKLLLIINVVFHYNLLSSYAYNNIPPNAAQPIFNRPTATDFIIDNNNNNLANDKNDKSRLFDIFNDDILPPLENVGRLTEGVGGGHSGLSHNHNGQEGHQRQLQKQIRDHHHHQQHHNPSVPHTTLQSKPQHPQRTSTPKHPLLSIVNFSSSSSSSSSIGPKLLHNSNANELSSSTELNGQIEVGPITSNKDEFSSSAIPRQMSNNSPGQTSESSDNLNNNVDGNEKLQRNPRRNSKLGQDFPILSVTESSPPAISSRPNSKDLSRNQPGSSMDDLLGGLAQLLGGNLKLPSNGNSNGLPMAPFSSAEQTKLAALLSQMTNGGPNNLGLNQRIPPHLQHLIPRGPNGAPMFPSFLPPKLTPPSNRPGPHGPPPPIVQPPPNSNYPPPFQLSFIPLLQGANGGANGQRPSQTSSASSPPTIPLNGNNNEKPKPPLHPPHGLTKPEMDALFHQFVTGNKSTTNQMISNLMSKLNVGGGDSKPNPIPIPIGEDSILVPFNLNDTSRVNHGHHLSTKSHHQQEPPPQIITMPNDDEGPSVFEMVVKHKMGPTETTKVGNIASQQSSSSWSSLVIRPTTTVPNMVTSSTTTSTDIQEIRNQHLNQQNKNSKTTEVVYGKRILPSTPPSMTISTISSTSIQPSFSTMTTVSTLSTTRTTYLLQGPLPTAVSTAEITPTLTSSSIAIFPASSTSPTVQPASTVLFGKPMVMQMPIENVKPKVGVAVPGTQQNFDTPKLPNSGVSSGTTTGKAVGGLIESKPLPVSGTGSLNKIPIGNSSSTSSSTNSLSKKSQAKPYVRRPAFRPRPNVPIVRIDTCIVGDDSTCDVSLNEKCITELGLSSCQCRPGFARTIPRTNCVPVISLALSFRVDKMAGNKVQFTRSLLNANSDEYQYLEFECIHAMNSLFAQTKTLNQDLMAVKINRFYAVGGRTVVNATVSLRNNDTSNSIQLNGQRIKRTLQQELTQVIIDSNNQLGESQLFVDTSSNAISRIDDLNECSSSEHNDCSKNARCINEFGGFRCECELGYEDKFPDDKWQSGRVCSTCSPQYCSNRGECLIVKGERVCRCRANFIGAQCDIDAEVLGVAIGGSIAALVIIVITFICLYMWNQRFRQEQQKIEAMSAASGHTFSYMNKPATMAATLSRMSLDERYGCGSGPISAGGFRSWATTATHGGGGYSDSQQHLLSSSSNGGYYNGGATNNSSTGNIDHQNASHVYAQPVRVVPSNGGGTTRDYHHRDSDYDPTGGGYHSSDLWSAHGRTRNSTKTKSSSRHQDYHQTSSSGLRSGTISGSTHGIHYPYKHDTYNETEFSTRELIYSPAHLYATNPRQSTHGYY